MTEFSSLKHQYVILLCISICIPLDFIQYNVTLKFRVLCGETVVMECQIPLTSLTLIACMNVTVGAHDANV